MIRGLSSGFNVATRAMQSSQWAMNIHLQNISNANDPSYTRRTLENRVDPYGRLPEVVRLRDMFIDEQFRKAQSSAGGAETRREIFNRIEDIFGDPVNSGLGLAIDQFFDAFKAVSEDPADEVLRIEAIEAGRQFAQQVHEAVSQLSLIKSQINEQIQSVVTEINGHLQNLRNLNGRIAALQGSSDSAADADLRDQRDRVLDDLARLTGARPTYLEDGTVRVMIGSVPAVDGLSLHQLELVEGVNGPSVKWEGIDLPEYAGSGVLPALLELRDQDIGEIMDTVDNLAKNMAKAVNQQHRQGYGLDGSHDQDFFLVQDDVPGGIYVRAEMTPEKVAAAGSATVLESDGTNADAIYQLAEGLQFLSDGITRDKSTSPMTLYRNLVGLVGSRGKAAIQDEEIAKAHMQVSQEQRSSKWGVSIDEEMAMLTAETKAFAAVARVMGVLDEMLETLINTVG